MTLKQWIYQLFFGPGKPVAACDQPPPAATTCHPDKFASPTQHGPTLCTDCAAGCAGCADMAVAHALPELACPGCGHAMKGVIGGPGNAGRPEPGHYVACLRCGHVSKLVAGPLLDECGGEGGGEAGERRLFIRSALSVELRAIAHAVPAAWQGCEAAQRYGEGARARGGEGAKRKPFF